MNVANFDRVLRQVILVPLAALLVAAAALLWQMHSANVTVGEIHSADERIRQTMLIEGLIIDEETGLRGYQITHDPVFLESYRRAEQLLPEAFAQRKALTANAQRSQAVADLQAAHDAWQDDFAESIIATLQAGGRTDDLALNLEGKRQINAIRERINALNQLTQQRRDEATDHWHQQVRLTFIAIALVSVLLGLILGYYIRRLLQEVSGAFRQSHASLRIRAEQAFRSEQKLRTTLQSIGDAVITCDPDGRIDSMNDVAQQLTGWSQAQASGLLLEQVFRIVNETTREPIENPVAKVSRLNIVVGLTNHTILIRRDGSEIFIDENGAPIRDKQSQIIGVVLVFRDVTLAKRSQQALIANEKLAVAGRLAATIAHEIHNPLDSVSNLLFLMDGNSTPEESAHFLELAKAEIARVTQISRSMLSLYRESKSPVAIDLKEMLDSILLLMARRFESLGVGLTTELPEDLIVHGFPAELRQVFTNLLTNAAEAAGRGGKVGLLARTCPVCNGPDGLRREAGAEVVIHDSGPGIPEEILAKLFQPFFTTKGEKGTGLGLWVSRGIITKHGGTLDLTSSTGAEDRGTTLTVYLATYPVIHPGGG